MLSALTNIQLSQRGFAYPLVCPLFPAAPFDPHAFCLFSHSKLYWMHNSWMDNVNVTLVLIICGKENDPVALCYARCLKKIHVFLRHLKHLVGFKNFWLYFFKITPFWLGKCTLLIPIQYLLESVLIALSEKNVSNQNRVILGFAGIVENQLHIIVCGNIL